jgi:hypothetical protein
MTFRSKSRIRRFIELPPEDRLLIVRTVFLLGMVRVGLWILPLRLIRGMLPHNDTSRLQIPVARLIWAVRAAGTVVPRTSCLVQSLALQNLLARSGHAAVVHVGVSKGSGFEAHAWVEYNKRVILGGPAIDRYTPILALEADR